MILTSLPTEIILYILDYLNPVNLFQCQQICRFWSSIIQSHESRFFRKHVRGHTNLYDHSWKSIYKERTLFTSTLPKLIAKNSLNGSLHSVKKAYRVHEDEKVLLVIPFTFAPRGDDEWRNSLDFLNFSNGSWVVTMSGDPVLSSTGCFVAESPLISSRKAHYVVTRTNNELLSVSGFQNGGQSLRHLYTLDCKPLTTYKIYKDFLVAFDSESISVLQLCNQEARQLWIKKNLRGSSPLFMQMSDQVVVYRSLDQDHFSILVLDAQNGEQISAIESASTNISFLLTPMDHLLLHEIDRIFVYTLSGQCLFQINIVSVNMLYSLDGRVISMKSIWDRPQFEQTIFDLERAQVYQVTIPFRRARSDALIVKTNAQGDLVLEKCDFKLW